MKKSLAMLMAVMMMFSVLALAVPTAFAEPAEETDMPIDETDPPVDTPDPTEEPIPTEDPTEEPPVPTEEPPVPTEAPATQAPATSRPAPPRTGDSNGNVMFAVIAASVVAIGGLAFALKKVRN